ncbi:MAG: HupE/UreJ family protein [Alphaproteobacteria bacterium]
MRSLLAGLVFGLVATLAGDRDARAHDLSMSVLELNQMQDGRFAMQWPGARPQGVENLNPIFPEHCVIDPPFVDCGDEGLVGRLSFEGLGAGQSAAMVRIKFTNGQTQAFTMTPAVPAVTVKPVFDGEGWDLWGQVFTSYLFIGIEHIMLGVDHLVFVLGLIWIVRTRWMLLKTITSFTVAHSITLAAVTFGVVGVPEQLVNALIALSIVFIGVEIIKQMRGETSLTIRHPWIVAFGFGLLHGFGFASALLNLGLPENSLLLALLAFNVGVEIGQVAFVLMVLVLMVALRSMALTLPEWGRAIPAYAIGGVAALWTVERVVVLLAP